MANTTITSVAGFRAAAMHCGIKASGKPDLALLVSDVPANASAVFTRNKVVGAPIIVGRDHVRGGVLRACVTNSGCANVCTGKRGVDDALKMCAVTADALAARFNSEVSLEHVLPFSTGVIGHFLPMDKIVAGIPQLVGGLSDSEEAGAAYANGILTTDLVTKTAHATVTIGGKRMTVAGNCKGSGMIAPNMGAGGGAWRKAAARDDAGLRGDGCRGGSAGAGETGVTGGRQNVQLRDGGPAHQHERYVRGDGERAGGEQADSRG